MKQQPGSAASGRSGLTVVELLCAIGITLLLAGLAIPAIVRTRETARRMRLIHVLWGDGPVASLSNSIDLRSYRAMACRKLLPESLP